MKWQRLYKMELLESTKDKGTIIVIILIIIVSLLIGYYQSTKGQRSLRVAIVNLDQGELGEIIVNEIKLENDIETVITKEKVAREMLRRDEVETLAIINEDFTKKILKGKYEGVINVINSTSSKYHATVIEPLINNIMVMWMEEKLLGDIKNLYDDYDIEYSNEKLLKDKEKIEEIRNGGSAITVNKIVIQDTNKSSLIIGWLYLSSAWYAVMTLFYLIISGSWIIEISNLNLSMRAKREGLTQGKMYFAMSTPKLTLILAGYMIVLMVSGFDILSLNMTFKLFFGFLVYSIGALGLSMLVASFSKSLTSLMLFAPFVTFSVGVLSGLVMNLPKWAYTFELISIVLPGRWYHEILIGHSNWCFAMLCSFLWLFIGYIVSNIRGKKLTKEDI